MARGSYLRRRDPLPLTFAVTVLARDPGVPDARSTDEARRVLRAELRIPASRLEPGPRGPRFHVVDFDASTRALGEPAVVTARPADGAPAGWAFKDRFKNAPDQDLLTKPAFRAQNVYAIAARTLDVFEHALGRPVPWAFDSPHLYLVPTAFLEANAYYADDDQAVYFGYFKAADGSPVYTCLAHDIVAHETTHAILDGLRSRFDVPGNADQAGFHEGFADVVALLSILSASETTAALLGDPRHARIKAEDLSVRALRQSVLVTIGKQFGDALHLNRGGGLRRSVELAPTKAWRDDDNQEWDEPHRRGEIFAAAVMQAFLRMWVKRVEPLEGAGTVDRVRAAEEGARAAGHLLEMVIRAIDYCPAVEFEFDDFLTALLAADAEVAPDDESEYRLAVQHAFAEFGIEPARGRQQRKVQPSFANFSAAALRSDANEAFRYVWDNAAYLGIDPVYYLHVESVRPATRVGPRGFVVFETVVDYVQELILTCAEFDERSGQPPLAGAFPGLAQFGPDTQLKLWGGGSIIFDEFGIVKYHHCKPIDDWKRQHRRLKYLVRHGLWDTRKRLGFSYGIPLGQRFAQFHGSAAAAGEDW